VFPEELKQLEVKQRAMWRSQFKLITQLKCSLLRPDHSPETTLANKVAEEVSFLTIEMSHL